MRRVVSKLYFYILKLFQTPKQRNNVDNEKNWKKVSSRFIIGHRFGILHSPLDGLEGGGVENFLSSPAVASVSSVQWPPVQNMNAQQETVVHDLKALQHLMRDKN